ncbi:MAG: peptide/nickel transport system permease protein [Solirubrobacteraceae bacterium]|nr:peptide/nickel transport system permease protein [Solirubrobacteraceae bacterium]
MDISREGSFELPALVDPDAALVARSPLSLFWRRLRRDRVALAALGFIVALLVVAIAAPLVVKVVGAPPPDQQSTAALDQFGSPTGPSGAHLFGVDQLGRDVFSRVIYGARVSLEVAFVSTGIAVVVGTAMGMAAGFYRGWVDTILSRLMDVLLAFPILLLGIGLASACALGNGCLGGLIKPGLTTVIFVIALATWPYIARIIRGQVLSLRERDFIEAARSLGASNGRIMARHILPNLVAPIIVYTTLIVPTNILFEAALSFLGVGVQPPQASWGQMIADATSIFDTAWWYMVFPGVALVLTVLAFNLVGDGLQDALNPRKDAT